MQAKRGERKRKREREFHNIRPHFMMRITEFNKIRVTKNEIFFSSHTFNSVHTFFCFFFSFVSEMNKDKQVDVFIIGSGKYEMICVSNLIPFFLKRVIRIIRRFITFQDWIVNSYH